MRSLNRIFLGPVSFCLVAFVCMAGLTTNAVGWQQSDRVQTGDSSNQATLYETRGDIKAFSLRLDHADDSLARTDAIMDLCYLYLRVVADERFSRSDILQGNRGRIASKLQKVRDVLKRDRRRVAAATKKQARLEKNGSRNSHESNQRYAANETTESVPMHEFESAVIDKQWLMIAHAAGGAAPSMYYAGGMQGTSGHIYRGRMGGIPDDNGDELLNLIQTIIHPDFWQINGGPGHAHYYQPLRILVVRATQRVHDDMHSLLIRLRGMF